MLLHRLMIEEEILLSTCECKEYHHELGCPFGVLGKCDSEDGAKRPGEQPMDIVRSPLPDAASLMTVKRGAELLGKRSHDGGRMIAG